jgi:small subunit ribosomal protein S13
MAENKGDVKKVEKAIEEEKAKSAKAKKGKKEKEEVTIEKKSLKGIVRLAGNDLNGELKLERALMYIKGIGHTMRVALANYISKTFNIPKDTKLNNLSEEQLETINNLLYSIDDKILPAFLLNRRNDMATGNNMHVIMNDLDFAVRHDIELKKRIRSWQGYRHIKGQKVRGQRTKNTGRTGPTVGVIKKKQKPGEAKKEKESKQSK